MLKTSQLTISTKLIAENFEYALESADRSKPTSVFHIYRGRQKYSLATRILGDSYYQPAEAHAKWGGGLERDSFFVFYRKLIINVFRVFLINELSKI